MNTIDDSQYLISIFDLQPSNEQRLASHLFSSTNILVIRSFSDIMGQYLAASYSFIDGLDQGDTIALIAAFFAFIGWRESSMKEEYIREETLRNRSDEIKLYRKQHKRSDRYPDQIEYKAEITSVRVAESPKFIYRLFRYFLLTKFQGKTQVTLSFEQEINPPLLSVVDSVYFWNLPIEKVSRTVQGDYNILIERTDMNRVEAEIHEVFESICHHAHSRKHLEIGEYTYPDITYHFPVGIFNEFLCRKELRYMKYFSSKKIINGRVGRDKELGMTSSLGTRPPLQYSVADNTSRFYRTFLHLIFINLPWSFMKNRVRKQNSRLDESELLDKHHLDMGDRPLHEGLYLLIDAYQDHEIVSTFQRHNIIDIDCAFLKIRSNRQDEAWSSICVPICRFHPKKFSTLEITRGKQHIDNHEAELDAKYVVRNREHFYTIYGFEQDGWIIAKWLEFDEEPGVLGVPRKVELSHSVSLVGKTLDGVIWKREE